MDTTIGRAAAMALVTIAMASTPTWAASPQQAAVMSVQPSQAAHQPPIVLGVRRDTADNEGFSTSANETLEMVLADGTSVTLAPGSSIVLDHYRYDPQERLGSLTLTVRSGAARVIGGILNNTAAITLRVPGAQASMDNGIAAISVGLNGSDIGLLLGKTITVTGTPTGQHALLRSAGQDIHVSSDGALGAMSRLSTDRARTIADTFNPGLASGVVPQFESDGTAGPAAGVADLTANVEGFAQQALLASNLPAMTSEAGSGTGEGSGSDTGSGSTGSNSGSAGSGSGSTAYSFPGCSGCSLSTAGYTLSGSIGGAVTLGDAGNESAEGWYRSWDEGGNLGNPYSSSSSSGLASAPPNTTSSTFSSTTFSSASGNTMPALVGSNSTPQNLAFSLGSSDDTQPAEELWLTDYSYNAADPANPNLVKFMTEGTGGNINNQIEVCLVVQSGCSSNQGAYNFSSASPELVDTIADNVCAGCSQLTSYLLTVGFQSFTANDSSGSATPPSDPADEQALCGTTNSTTCAGYLNSALQNLDQTSATFIYAMPDYFLAYELTGETSGGTWQTFLFATGSVSGPYGTNYANNESGSVDYFTVAAGLADAAGGSRGFVPEDADLPSGEALGIPVVENGLVIINPPPVNETFPSSQMMDSDVALGSLNAANAAPSGTSTCGAYCSSTISLTLGELTYPSGGGNPSVTFATIGSSGTSSGTLQFVSNPSANSTVVGGGNPALPADGEVGYLVPTTVGTICAGAIGANYSCASSVSSQSYTMQSIATGTGSNTGYNPGTGGSLSGYIAGLATTSNATGCTGNCASLLTSSDLSLSPNTQTGTISGTAQIAAGGSQASLTIGGTCTTGFCSAYLGPDADPNDSSNAGQIRFGAFAGTGTTPTAAFVSSGELNANPLSQATYSALPQISEADASYLQWGFFFGDVVANGTTWTAQLIPWIVGEPSTTSLPTTGQATYTGIVAGNVYYNQNLYAVTGKYTNTWNFQNNTGTGAIVVDNAGYGIKTTLTQSGAFSGAVYQPVSAPNNQPSSTPPTTGTQVGAMNGAFTVSSACTYCGNMGTIEISDATGAVHGSPYTLVGVFGGTSPSAAK